MLVDPYLTFLIILHAVLPCLVLAAVRGSSPAPRLGNGDLAAAVAQLGSKPGTPFEGKANRSSDCQCCTHVPITAGATAGTRSNPPAAAVEGVGNGHLLEFHSVHAPGCGQGSLPPDGLHMMHDIGTACAVTRPLLDASAHHWQLYAWAGHWHHEPEHLWCNLSLLWSALAASVLGPFCLSDTTSAAAATRLCPATCIQLLCNRRSVCPARVGCSQGLLAPHQPHHHHTWVTRGWEGHSTVLQVPAHPHKQRQQRRRQQRYSSTSWRQQQVSIRCWAMPWRSHQSTWQPTQQHIRQH